MSKYQSKYFGTVLIYSIHSFANGIMCGQNSG